MEIIREESNNYKLHNQKTGEVIIDEVCDDDAKSLIGYWHSEIIGEPTLNHDDMKVAWENLVRKIEEEEDLTLDFTDLEKFLEEYENPDWKVFEIESSGIACGPVYETLWMVVEKDVVFEDKDE